MRRAPSSETFGEGKDDGHKEIGRWKVCSNFYDRCLLVYLQKEHSQGQTSVELIFKIIFEVQVNVLLVLLFHSVTHHALCENGEPLEE